MKVHVIKRQTIESFVVANASSKKPFETWWEMAKSADWDIPQDILQTFANADLLGKGTSRVVFDIGGNNYRMLAKYAFGEREVHLFICWIGTHAQYDKLCNNNEQYTISYK